MRGASVIDIVDREDLREGGLPARYLVCEAGTRLSEKSIARMPSRLACSDRALMGRSELILSWGGLYTLSADHYAA